MIINSLSHTDNKPSMLIKDSLTNPFLNLQKPHQQKTTQSSLIQKEDQHPSSEQYTKLQQLLQNRQASLREHAKRSYQLKLYIEDLQEKNKILQKNNQQIIAQYKNQVSQLKKENDQLKKLMKSTESQNIDLKKQLQYFMQKNDKKISIPKPNSQRIQSQSVIKVIDYQDQQHSFRQTLLNSKLAGKQFPLFQNYSSSKSRLNSHSGQKLQVTIKTSRQDRFSTLGRNQNNIGSMELYKYESQQQQRSIKKLIDLKKLQDSGRNKNQENKIQKLFGQKLISSKSHKKSFSERKSQSQWAKQQNLLEKDRLTIKKLAKEFQDQYAPTNNKPNSINSNIQRTPVSIRKRKNQHQLIKLGHYGNSGSRKIQNPQS